MHFIPDLIACLASVSAVSAVGIRNYRAGTCKGSNFGQCENVKTYACCDKSATKSVYSSSLFKGLPTTGLGVLCNREAGKNCGRVHQAGNGLSACVAKSNTRGSFWFDCRQTGTCPKGRATQPDVSKLAHIQAIETVTPDIVGIDYHQFYTNETTPEYVVDALFELLETDVIYEDIPAELKKYEKLLNKEEQEQEDAEWGV
ncbi:hypothetical protein FHETE_2592 [Fusarium heterosporum]|uniref:Uncharacterized protein n=1 Tax=Fusarium heterosporum TaxID=42747 RepID=A0A8H5TRJ4_FUSHE|nr:hypothetical protein FHETE_2592 [Fusarium heterosporum]